MIIRSNLTIGRHQDVLQEFPDMFFDSLVTDPPYGLKFMGHHWDYQVPTVEDWKPVIRALKPGAYGLVFCGTRTQHRMVVNLEDAGLEVRDVITWVHSNGFPKNMKVDRPGWGTALKPATEFITLVRKPMIGTTHENLRTHGVGVINIDGCRVAPTGESLDGGDVKYRGKKKSASEGWDRPWMNDEEKLRARAERGTEAQEKGEKLGRYPANFVHDGSAEVLELFPHSAGAASPVKRGYPGKSKGKYNDFATKGDDGETFYNDSGSAARFFYCAKPSTSERDAGTTDGNIHPTVKPMALMRYLVRLITPVGGTCLDPYAGSGTTGCACLMEGMNSVLIDQDPANEVTIRERLAYWEAEAAKGVQAKLW